ncbi:beta-glucosidase 17-like isoform X2 [Humulus lupulus]|uniref:beta-glucosidase 17-like isoform X2 n=1 Tax=Humulus lupulus TaxID=3486 RepID=UPI002B40B179|nr:beta-glucosidase 17-like isoform X2 [Humulus lupulus]
MAKLGSLLLRTVMLLIVISFSAALADISRSSFPEDFIFGAGSSAYQSEGASLADGRGPSVWDTFTHINPDKISDQSNGDVANDFYHRYKEDIQMMKKIGLDSFRFSISWSRILPNGKISGGVNSIAVKFYNNLINELLSNGIKPLVTLLHYDTPQALEDEYTSWLSPKIVNDYLEYSNFCFKTFGDRVKFWVTMNEPNGLCINGYNNGIMAPGRCSNYIGNCSSGHSATEPYIAAHHMLLAHAATVRLYRVKYQPYQKGTIGITIISPWFIPKYSTPASRRAANRSLEFFFGWFAHPITYGDYSQIIKSTVGERLPKFTKAQSKLLTGSLDFLGLNYYTSFYAEDVTFSNYSVEQSYDADIQAIFTSYKNKTPIGTPGIRDILFYIKEKYNNPPIYITENGMPDANNSSLSIKEALKDIMRIRYHQDHLSNLLEAIKDGVNVKGYYIWSYMDDFEWSNGYTLRFGLIFIDFKNNLQRYLKYSAYWLKMFLHKNPINII